MIIVSKNLLEQASQRVIEINKTMSEIEKFEDIINAGQDAEIAFADKVNTTYITVLSPEKMQELKEMVLNAIFNAKDEKTTELERLLGIYPDRKPTVNPVFEIAEQGTVPQNNQDLIEDKLAEILDKQAQEISGKPEMTVDAVKKLYIEDGKSYQEMAEYFGVKKTDVNNFITRNHLRELKQKHIYGYEKKQKKPAVEKDRP